MSKYAQTCPIIYGKGSTEQLGEETNNLGCRKVLVVTDQGVEKTDSFKNSVKSLEKAQIEVVVFDKVIPDPPDYIINEGGELAQKEEVDGIVAVGGGSPMDAAKGINILINNPLPINQYFGDPTYQPGVPVIMVPTTAGTGSESTSIAVVTDTTNDAKNSVIGNADLGILDPENTTSLPFEITAQTAIDTLAHAAEAITAKIPNPRSELMAVDAIEKVVNNLEIVLNDSEDLEARGNLLLASNFAGIAFNDALVHLGHALAHSIGAKFHLTHGVVCGLALPEVMIYAAEVKPNKVKTVGEAFGLNFSEEESDSQIAEKTAAEIREFVKKAGIKSFAELGISKEELVDTAEMVKSDACYNFVPRELTAAEIENILAEMYDNYK
ncbi:MAG: iron-containing alcohol dehydrogenase [Halanaerobiales bacterium]|nr:iron-containing alcohol dehydrogenase [Halanaerobiales bacterium]